MHTKNKVYKKYVQFIEILKSQLTFNYCQYLFTDIIQTSKEFQIIFTVLSLLYLRIFLNLSLQI